jgi:hypothetical protein
MTTFRIITLPTHAAIELLGGLALLAAPFVLGFGSAGLILAVVLGVVLVGLALGAAEDLPVTAHLTFDQAVTAGLVAAAVVLTVGGDGVAALTFALAALLQLALTLATRYSRAPVLR